jgi:hypothetical protein
MDFPAARGSVRVMIAVARPFSTELADSGNSKPKKKSPATIGEPATFPATRAPGALKSNSRTSATSKGCARARNVTSWRR